MEGDRFDDLARRLAGSGSRRSLLKGAVAALGAVLAGTRAEGGDAQECRPAAARCTASRPCCADLSCVSNTCVPQPGPCAAPGQACGSGQPCCPGTTCAGGVCCPAPQACGDQCCTGGTQCEGGVCASSSGSRGCPAGQTRCGAAGCRDLQGDAANCGSCGRVCPSGLCAGGVCLSATGAACGTGGECVSGFCVDGVCCGGACGGQCEACNLPGAAGVCSLVTGAPVGGRAACGGAGACAGTCAGLSSGCVFPSGLACADAVCDGATDAFVTYACSGAGGCEGTPTPCGRYGCNAAGCLTACAGDGDCAAGSACTGGVCGDPLLPDGAGCATPGQCLSGSCTGGVCGTACPLGQGLCNGVCIGFFDCCDDNDCGFRSICERSVCNQSTRLCEIVDAETDPECVSDACVERACVDGVCQETPPSINIPFPCFETICDPVRGYIPGAPKVCNTPGPGETGPGECVATSGCVYPNNCAVCQTLVAGVCVDNCPPDTVTSCTDGQPGICNRDTGFCKYTSVCGNCETCGLSRTCEPVPDGTVVVLRDPNSPDISLTVTCCGGAQNTFCNPGICGTRWRDTTCCGTVFGDDECCRSPATVQDGICCVTQVINGVCCAVDEVNVDGNCCPAGKPYYCAAAGAQCCDHECTCSQLGCFCL